VLAVPALGLAACGSGSGSSSGSSSTAAGGGKAATKIGFIVDKTGPLAPIGAGYARGVDVATAEWNAGAGHRPVTVQSCDSQSTGDGAIACYQKLRNSVAAISGPSVFIGLASVRSLAARATSRWSAVRRSSARRPDRRCSRPSRRSPTASARASGTSRRRA
jgi:hypothetical protein